MTPGSELMRLKQVTLGGEIADGRILDLLRERYPKARVSHIYASTEAGVGFSVSDGQPGFPLTFLDEPPLNVAALRIKRGRLFVQNAEVGSSYLCSSHSFVDADGFVDTGDAVEVRGDRVHFLGRADGTINVGGNKLHPEQVERVLLEHPNVAQARVFGISNPLSGSLVAAELLAHAGVAVDCELKQSIRRFCAGQLQRFQVPAVIRFVDNMDLSAGGKLERHA